jgi:hypothetical protein
MLQHERTGEENCGSEAILGFACMAIFVPSGLRIAVGWVDIVSASGRAWLFWR